MEFNASFVLILKIGFPNSILEIKQCKKARNIYSLYDSNYNVLKTFFPEKTEPIKFKKEDI